MPSFVVTPGYTTSGTQHQAKRGPTSQVSKFVGAQGEPVFDTQLNRVGLCDGTSTGGWPQATAAVQTSLGNDTIAVGVAMDMVFSTAVAPTITLPPVASYNPGQRVMVWDAGGNAATLNITVAPNGSDLIYTSSGGSTTAVVISVAGRHAAFIPNSSVHWLLESTL